MVPRNSNYCSLLLSTLGVTTLVGGTRTVYTLISIPKGPYIHGQSGTNTVVGISLDTTTPVEI